MLTALRLLLARFNPHALRTLALVLGVLLLLSGADYARRSWQRYHLRQAETRAEAAAAQRHTQAQQRTRAYQLDSTRRATERRALRRVDSTLAAQDHALSAARPAFVDLPAAPPRERPATAPPARHYAR